MPNKSKAKPLKKKPVVIQRASFRWMKGTGLVLKQEILSAYEVSKKVIHLLRHSQKEQREDDGAVQFWRIKEHLQNQFPKNSFLVWRSLKKMLGSRKSEKEIPVLHWRFWNNCLSPSSFKDIHDAILLILGCKKMLWFRADSCNILTTLDVRLIFILSSTID